MVRDRVRPVPASARAERLAGGSCAEGGEQCRIDPLYPPQLRAGGLGGGRKREEGPDRRGAGGDRGPAEALIGGAGEEGGAQDSEEGRAVPQEELRVGIRHRHAVGALEAIAGEDGGGGQQVRDAHGGEERAGDSVRGHGGNLRWSAGGAPSIGEVTTTALPETCAVPGTLWVSPATAVYLGPSLGLAAHSTSVHCLVVGVDGPLQVQVGSHTVSARSVLVPPRTVHRVLAHPGERILFCYNDVTAVRARELTARMAHAGEFATGHRAEAELLRLCEENEPSGAALVAAAFGTGAPPDPRVQRSIERVRADPAGCSAPVLAQAEHVSTPYFLRVFGRETGTSFRRYRLWVRMLRAAESIAAGADLTRAAADAGFASSSHFSDAFLAMFGLSATALFGTGVRLVVGPEAAEWIDHE